MTLTAKRKNTTKAGSTMRENLDNLLKKRNRIAKHVGEKPKTASEVGFNLNANTTVINRDILLDDFLKLITVAPIEPFLKEILRIRVMYPDAAIRIYMHLGNKHGVRLHDILELETVAKRRVIDYLKGNEMQATIDKFNIDHGKDAVDIKNKAASEGKDFTADKGDADGSTNNGS